MKKLQIKDLVEYRFISKLEVAPKGRHAAFVVSQANWDENGYDHNIHLLDTSTEQTRQLTYTGDAKGFFWLNDSEIVFPALREKADKEKTQKGEKLTVFYKMNIHGGEAHVWLKVPQAVEAYKKLSENALVLSCVFKPGEPDFESLDEAGKKAAYQTIEEEKNYEVLDEIPFWSNGRGFTNKKRKRLYIYDTEKKQAVPITSESLDVEDFNAKDGKIVYTGHDFHDKRRQVSGIWLYDVAGQTTGTVLPETDWRVSFVNFCGDKIVAKATQGKKTGMSENPALYVAEKGEMKPLADPDENMGTYTNSDSRLGAGFTLKVADNGNIYYTATHHVQNVLRCVKPDGTVETLFQGFNSIDGFDLAGDKIICCSLAATTLHELHALEGGALRKLTGFNDKFVAEVTLTKPEYLEAKGERETIEGFVLKPVGFDPAKKYPAILNIHGGPKTAFGDTYFHEMHVWAAKGWFVVFCNPWGSDGRGSKFADLRGQYGTVDYNDLMTFADKALGTYPQIDKERFAVTGGSYGGFMTNWMICHTDRFKCAASQRSISNWISKFGTTDIGYYFNADQMASTPWSDPDKIWWHSPVKYADKCKTPTLFLHSDEDYRCWLPEALQMFTALKFHGVESRLCMFKGENHELSRSGKPKHRVRRIKEMVDWFDKYLG
ncbi:MAG: S9 family peptidase [Spirochaetes bacterium]|nr:S9 family peptidase [Spirochaetota bacterium]